MKFMTHAQNRPLWLLHLVLGAALLVFSTTAASKDAQAASEPLSIAIEDVFDWGDGVANRQSLRSGRPVSEMLAMRGGTRWKQNSPRTTAVLGGESGPGGGNLLLFGRNSIVAIDVGPMAKAEAKVAFQVEQAGRGLDIGFQVRDPQFRLLAVQQNKPESGEDSVRAAVLANGVVLLEAVVDGKQLRKRGRLAVAEGQTAMAVLQVDLEAGKAQLLLQNSERKAIRMELDWKSGGRRSNLEAFAINQYGDGQVLIHGVSITGTRAGN